MFVPYNPFQPSPVFVCGATTLSITTFSIMTPSKEGFYVKLCRSDTQHDNYLGFFAECTILFIIMLNVFFAEYRYAECRGALRKH